MQNIIVFNGIDIIDPVSISGGTFLSPGQDLAQQIGGLIYKADVDNPSPWVQRYFPPDTLRKLSLQQSNQGNVYRDFGVTVNRDVATIVDFSKPIKEFNLTTGELIISDTFQYAAYDFNGEVVSSGVFVSSFDPKRPWFARSTESKTWKVVSDSPIYKVVLIFTVGNNRIITAEMARAAGDINPFDTPLTGRDKVNVAAFWAIATGNEEKIAPRAEREARDARLTRRQTEEAQGLTRTTQKITTGDEELNFITNAAPSPSPGIRLERLQGGDFVGTLFASDGSSIRDIKITSRLAVFSDEYYDARNAVYTKFVNYDISRFRNAAGEIKIPPNYDIIPGTIGRQTLTILFEQPLTSVTLNIESNGVGVISLYNKDNQMVAYGDWALGTKTYTANSAAQTLNVTDLEIRKLELSVDPYKIFIISIDGVQLPIGARASTTGGNGIPFGTPGGSLIAGGTVINTTGYGGPGNHTHGVLPNPHTHEISPDPHTHRITPNPHRHMMRFESGSFTDGRRFDRDRDCPIGPDVLINLIFKELNTETAKEKSRVSMAARKGNWITANKIGKPIWDYLENYYIERIICYLRARIWYTEFESLEVVPTDLDIVPTALQIQYGGYGGAYGNVGNAFAPPPAPPPPPREPEYVSCYTPNDFGNPELGFNCQQYSIDEFKKQAEESRANGVELANNGICWFPNYGYAKRCGPNGVEE